MSTTKPGNQGNKLKTQMSMVICEAEEKKHRSGVNALQVDPILGKLYSAGRDSLIRVTDISNNQNKFMQCMEHHTDWVNDIVLCCGGRNLISASSDTLVKVWNAHKGFCMSTLRTHKDYVKALAYAKDIEQVASAGLDKSIYLWDVNTLNALTASNNTVITSSLIGNKESIYSLAMNPSGTVIVNGSSEKAIQIWDPRTSNKMFKLKGHADNIRALVVSRDGNQVLSGSSDGNIKLWNIGQQRCIQTISVHTDSVWALLATENFSHVISGGRDMKVIMTELKNPLNYVIVCTEKAFITKLCFSADCQAVWVSTLKSDIRCWKLPTEKHFKGEAEMPQTPINVILGGASIIEADVLNDKRHILTKDTDGVVAVYDVLNARKVEEVGKVNFNEERNKRQNRVYVPTWFNCDLKTGMLMIHLGQDEVDCFAAWVSAKEAGLSDEAEQKVNYGKLLLQALLEHWKPIPSGEKYCSVPNHTPLIISEVGGRALYRVQVGNAKGDAESAILEDTVPKWVLLAMEDNFPNKFVKVNFYLQPHSTVPHHLLKIDRNKKIDRLAANDFIQCRKVAEHIIEKILTDNPTAASPAGADGDPVATPMNLSVDQIELTCNDQVLDPCMDLRTVKHYIWKSTTDLTFYFKVNIK